MMSSAWLRARPGWVVAGVVPVAGAGGAGGARGDAAGGPGGAEGGVEPCAALRQAPRGGRPVWGWGGGRALARRVRGGGKGGAGSGRLGPPADGVDACVARTVAALSRQ